jgi:hypothetical protein
VLLLSCCRKLIHKGCYNEKVRQTYDLAKKKQEVINLGSAFPDDRKTQKIFIEAQRGKTAISCPYCRGIPELLNIDEQSGSAFIFPAPVSLNPGVLKEKELAEARAVFEKHGLSVAAEPKKRGEKAEGKANRQEKSETKSVARSGISKHTVGSKLGNRAIVKEVSEKDWIFISKDEKRNKYYQCKRCNKENIR